MREHKFRIWSFLEKSFYYFSIGDGEHGYPQGLAGGVSEIQDFVNLKDCDGKEIYEGDIVRWSLAGINGVDIHTISIIKYEHFGFVLSDCLGGGAIPLTYIEDMKIIGNIFERPCKADHNGECIFCDENVNECPIN